MTYDAVLNALLGGGLIGVAASILLLWNGRIAGISGMAKGLLDPKGADTPWRFAFLLGLVVGGLVYSMASPSAFAMAFDRPFWLICLAGFLVGVGQTLANGCTSGHGVCGVGRFSVRSIVATTCFMLAGFTTVFLYNLASK